MTKKNFCSLWQQFKSTFLPIAMGSALLASASLSGDDALIRSKCRQRHHNRDRCKFNQFLVSGLTQINPTTDFLLQDASAAIADLFQPFLPDLSDPLIIGQYNTYTPGDLYVNPFNKDNIFAFFAQDTFRELFAPRTYGRLTNAAGAQLAISDDGGNSWHYTIPLLPTWLGGTLGQTAGGTKLGFLGENTLLLSGVTNNTRPIPPLVGAQSHVVVTKSFDGGLTWSNPIILQTGASGSFNIPLLGGPAVGISTTSDDILINRKAAIVSMTNIDLSRNTLYGNIWFSRSRDGGDTWSPASILYDAASDPKFVAQYGYENLTLNPPISLKGQSGFSTLVSVPGGKHGSDVLLAGFLRLFPKRGAFTYDQVPEDSLFDHAVVRSFDNGRTWTREAVQVGGQTYILGTSHDPRIPGVFELVVADGALTSAIAVSPKTGRVYYAWQGGNPAFDPDPSINQFFPTIQLSSSCDQGATWTLYTQVSRTPLNRTVEGANQAFNPNIAVTDCGYVGITYEDFRFYDGGPEFVQTDVWLAIYKETECANGGSTGVGLDFVTEVRLTPQSFNAAIGFQAPLPQISIGNSTGLDVRDNQFVTTFSVTNETGRPLVEGPFGSLQDVNNRLNVFFEKVSLKK